MSNPKPMVTIRSHSEYVRALERRWLLSSLLPPGGVVDEEYKQLNRALTNYESVSQLRGIPKADLVATRRMALFYFRAEGRRLERVPSWWELLLSYFLPPRPSKPWQFAVTMGPVMNDWDEAAPKQLRSKQMNKFVRTADQVETFKITGGADADGNAVDLGALPSKPEWTSSNPEAVVVTPSDDGLSASFKYEKVGTSTVTIVAKDADGKVLVESADEYEVQAGRLAGFSTSSDGPTDGE